MTCGVPPPVSSCGVSVETEAFFREMARYTRESGYTVTGVVGGDGTSVNPPVFMKSSMQHNHEAVVFIKKIDSAIHLFEPIWTLRWWS